MTEWFPHHVSWLLNFLVTTFPSSCPRRSAIFCDRSGWELPLNILIFGILGFSRMEEDDRVNNVVIMLVVCHTVYPIHCSCAGLKHECHPVSVVFVILTLLGISCERQGGFLRFRRMYRPGVEVSNQPEQTWHYSIAPRCLGHIQNIMPSDASKAPPTFSLVATPIKLFTAECALFGIRMMVHLFIIHKWGR